MEVEHLRGKVVSVQGKEMMYEWRRGYGAAGTP